MRLLKFGGRSQISLHLGVVAFNPVQGTIVKRREFPLQAERHHGVIL